MKLIVIFLLLNLVIYFAKAGVLLNPIIYFGMKRNYSNLEKVEEDIPIDQNIPIQFFTSIKAYFKINAP